MGSVLDYASPYRTKEKKANEAYPINSALKSSREKREYPSVSMKDEISAQGPLEELKELRISGQQALELVFKNQYVLDAIASVPQYKADDN